jgi:hypothetical protein
MNRLLIIAALLIALAALLCSCATYDAADQGPLPYGQVRSKSGLSQVHIGMTPDQVQGLIGRPDRIGGISETAAGTELCWLYAESSFLTMGEAVRVGLSTWGTGGRPATGMGVIKMTFVQGKLSSKEYINS